MLFPILSRPLSSLKVSKETFFSFLYFLCLGVVFINMFAPLCADLADVALLSLVAFTVSGLFTVLTIQFSE